MDIVLTDRTRTCNLGFRMDNKRYAFILTQQGCYQKSTGCGPQLSVVGRHFIIIVVIFIIIIELSGRENAMSVGIRERQYVRCFE